MVTQAVSARRYVTLTLALLWLSGCSTFELLDVVRTSEPDDPQSATFDPNLADQTSGPEETTGEALPRKKPAPPATTHRNTAPDKPAPAPRLNSESLIGLDEDAAIEIFGAPHFVIRQQPATRWHYVSTTCTLDLFFFEDLETRARRILAFDVGAARPGANTDGLNACATSIRTERHDRTG